MLQTWSRILKHGSLFSGIGGFDLAARWNGWQNIFQVEIDDYCNKVLEKNFPEVQRFRDIKEFNAKQFTNRIDVLSGGFPCQPFSVAGKRRGTDDERYLWHEMLRVIREAKPRWVVVENVRGLLTIENGMVFEQVRINLENEGYETQEIIIPAASKNAPHKRDRLWIIANAEKLQCDERNDNARKRTQEKPVSKFRNGGGTETITDTEREGLERRVQPRKQFAKLYNGQNKEWNKEWTQVASKFCRVDDGIPNRVDRLKGLGNAIVPQIAYEIFRAIEYADSQV